MATVKPFRGMRPPAEMVKKLAAPPYDVVSTEEARAYAKGNDACFFHISRPEIEFPAGTDEHSDRVYQRALSNLRGFISREWLVQEKEPCFYLYRQKMGAHVQVGLVACASVDEYDRGLVKKHELTRTDKEDDRTRHIEVLGGNDEPVFLTYRADKAIDALVEEGTRGPPEYDFVTEDGIAHTFWVVKGALVSKLERAFEKVPALYIADGHHRSAAASRVCEICREKGAPRGEHEYFLSVVFPHDQMRILPYNRVVKDLAGLTPEQLLARIGERFVVEPTDRKEPRQLHELAMYLDGKWYRLVAKEGSFPSTPTGELDVSILQLNLLAPTLGIGDPRTDKRIAFVGGIRGPGELERLVNSGEYAVAFSLYPTRLSQLMAIADANQIMPPKSTWFEPKLRSGLVLHLFH